MSVSCRWKSGQEAFVQLPITASLAHDETLAAEVQGRGPVFGYGRQGSLCSVLNARTPRMASEISLMIPSFALATSTVHKDSITIKTHMSTA